MGLLATAIKLISNTVSLRRLQSESIPQKPCSPRSWCLRTGTLNMVYPKTVMMSWEQSHQMSRMRQVSRGVSHHFEIRHESCVWAQKQKQAVNTLVSKQTKLKLFLKQMLFFFLRVHQTRTNISLRFNSCFYVHLMKVCFDLSFSTNSWERIWLLWQQNAPLCSPVSHHL